MSIKDTTQQQREREEEETKKRKREIETGIVKKISYLDMTRRRSSRTPSPPRGDRKMPPGFIPYDGIKEEEIEALKLVFRLDGSNPYKDDPYNVKRFMPNNIKGFMPYKDDPYSIKGFMPMTRYYESDFRAYLTTLHDDNMEVEDKYVAIQDLIKQMFHTQHAWIPPTWASGSRYRYSKSLHTYLHQSEPPSATRRRTGILLQPLEQEQHSNNIDLLSCCILWSPLHPITSFLPFIGHMGISDSIGQPHDAEGCFDARGHFNPLIQYIPRIQYSSMEFGHLVRYLKVDIAVDINGRSRRMESMDKAEEWDEAIDRFDGIGGHSHVARILNRIGYRGRYDWSMMELYLHMFFYGSFTVDINDTYTSSILSQFGPFLVIILLLIILLSSTPSISISIIISITIIITIIIITVSIIELGVRVRRR